jgi:hypothetical protein
MLENDELELRDIIRMYPVLRSLAHEVLLLSSGCRVAFDGISASSDAVVELGEFDDEGVVVVLEKWLLS